MRYSGPLSGRRSTAWLAALFTLSGASGLCFEILWARQLQVALGSTSKAITTVVSLFMMGLALGGTLGARWAPRVRRPGFCYGLAELGIGLSGLAVTLTLPHLESLGSLGLRYLGAALLLLLPSTVMGMTFPLVMQTAQPRARAGGAGLYSANTAGAALGCALAGFLGIGLLGIRATAQAAALVNLLCGVIACVLFRGSAALRDGAAGSEAAPKPPRRFAVLLAAGLCGASALATEVLWTRALIPYVNSSSYAFAAIMVCFLAGLALGSAWVAGRYARLSDEALVLRLVVCQLLLAVLVASSPHLMRGVEGLLPIYVGVRRVQSLADWSLMVAGVFAKSSLVVLPATLLMGASLPLCIALVAGTGRTSGRAAGHVSAINTVGGVLGSIAAGFLLLPALGGTNSLLLVASGNLGAAALVGYRRTSTQRRTVFAGLGSALAVILVLFLTRPAAPFLGRLAAGAKVLLVDEGPQDTTAIIERGSDESPDRVVLSNGISYAGDAPAAHRYMALLGHLPVLFARDVSRALVICVGTGTTAANVAIYREVKALDLVDISPAVHRTLPFFVSVNRRVWADPRVTIHEADGRQFMTRAPHRYGVITLEPPPPRAAGAASLYTQELYLRARAALAPGGVIAQWLPLHGMTESELLLLARTFVAVFPESALLLLNPVEAALLGSPEPLVFSSPRVQERLQDPEVRATLRRIGFTSGAPAALATELLALAAASGPSLHAMVGDGPVVTDDRPLIEQFATLLTDRQGLDPDGRRGILRRLSQIDPTLAVAGTVPPGLPAARSALRGQVRSWLQPAVP